MELRQLRYFAAVAETCHFGQAAERLHLAQPALSQTVRQLESDLGAVLFTRTTRRVALTPAGEFLYAETRRILDTIDATAVGVRRLATGHTGLVRLGLTGAAAMSHLPRIARQVRQELPNVALEIHADLLTPAQCERLRDGTLDLGVLRPPAVGDGIELHTIGLDPLVLAIPAEHWAAAGSGVTLSSLRDEMFVMYGNRDSAVNDAVLRTCREAGFVPQREQDAPDTPVLLALVAAGLGVALVPGSVRSLSLDGLVFRDVADAGAVELALAWARGNESPAIVAVRDVVVAELSFEQTAERLAASGTTGGRQ